MSASSSADFCDGLYSTVLPSFSISQNSTSSHSPARGGLASPSPTAIATTPTADLPKIRLIPGTDPFAWPEETLLRHSLAPQDRPHLFRRDRDVQVRHAQMPQRIDYGVGDRRRRAHRRRLAHALRTQRMVRRGRDGL